MTHATAVLVGRHAVLIRGLSGSGKSTLALRLLDRAGPGSFRALVGDDQVRLERHGSRIIARPPATIERLIEARGVGILRQDVAMSGVVALVVDLVPAAEAPRLPEDEAIDILGIRLPHVKLASDSDTVLKVERALCHLAHGSDAVLSHGGPTSCP